LDLDVKLSAGLADFHAHGARPSMLGDVRQCLLHQSIDGALEIRVESRLAFPVVGQRDLAVDLQATLLAVTVEQRLDRDLQSQLVEGRGTQLGDDRPEVLDLPLDRRASGITC
jgi:hypothetical protein